MGAMLYYVFGQAHRRAVVGLYAFDTGGASAVPRTEQEVADYLVRRMGNLPLLYQKLAPTPLNLDNPVWVDDPAASARSRVSTRTVTGAGSWADVVETFVGLASEPEACAVPFEVIVLEGVAAEPQLPPGAVVVVLRTDHAAMDGSARATLERTLFTSEPADWRRQAAPTPYRPGSAPSGARILASAIRGLPARALTFGSLLARARSLPPQGEDAAAPAATAPAAVPGGTAQANEFFTVPLRQVARARAVVKGATVNDVVLAAVATALRANQGLVGPAPEAPIRCFIPVALEGQADRLGGNKFTQGIVPLWTSVPEVRERLRATRDSTAAIKAGAATGRQTLVEQAFLAFLAPVSAWIHLRQNRGAANATVTNVYRGPRPLYFGDARAVRTHLAMRAAMENPLVVQVTNLEDQLMFSLTAAPPLVPRPELFRQQVRDAFAELAALAG